MSLVSGNETGVLEVVKTSCEKRHNFDLQTRSKHLHNVNFVFPTFISNAYLQIIFDFILNFSQWPSQNLFSNIMTIAIVNWVFTIIFHIFTESTRACVQNANLIFVWRRFFVKYSLQIKRCFAFFATTDFTFFVAPRCTLHIDKTLKVNI